MRNKLKIVFSRMPITIVLLLIQLGWIGYIVLRLDGTTGWIKDVISWITIIVAIYIVSRRDNPAYKLIWILMLLALPVFGVLLYLLFGHSGVSRQIKKAFAKSDRQFEKYLYYDDDIVNELKTYDKQLYNTSRYITNIAKYPIYRNHYIKYHPLGDDGLADLLNELKKAQKFIFMEYFIVEPEGKVFSEILEVLEEKHKAGVDVRLMFDDIGSLPYVDKKCMAKLKQTGINFRRFNPVLPVLAAFMNNRDHRKITVIDGKVGFMGGYNLADEYANINCKFGHWKDTGVLIKGKAVDNLTAMFLGMWNVLAKGDTSYGTFFDNAKYDDTECKGYVQPYADTPLDKEHVGKDVYLNIIKTATDYVYMYTPYLIIDDEMISQLCLAAMSGVDVRIVTPGIPDKKMVFMATKSYYPQLIEAGVRIYEYKPGFLHAKTFVSDDEVASVSSINLDFRSLYLHFESGVIMYCCDEIENIRKDFENTFEKSVEITKKDCDERGLLLRIMQSILRLFAPIL
ncbi:MAG: cardiolipin synthase [Lachnospiraceae bacterium]|nr:cardiolipin synthase [Lachnospiraceae bacterium]